MLVLAAVAAGVLAVFFPVRLFGVSRRPLEYSISGRIIGHYGSVFCDRNEATRSRWRCEVFHGGPSTYTRYVVDVSKKGCWTARAPETKPVRACLRFRDYVRLLDR